MSAEAIIKGQARDALKHNYIQAISVMLITLLPFYIINGTTTALSIALSKVIGSETLASFLIFTLGYAITVIGNYLFSPLLNGFVRAYYKAADGNEMQVSNAFQYFQKGRYSAALRLNLSLFLRMLLPTALFYLPLIIFEIISVNAIPNFCGTVLYNDVYFLLAVLSTTLTVLYALRYLTVMTISADFEYMTTKQVFDYNKYIMKHRSGNAAKLIFSFVPWLLLCLLVLPMLYVIPYLSMSLCISAKWMIKAAFEVN